MKLLDHDKHPYELIREWKVCPHHPLWMGPISARTGWFLDVEATHQSIRLAVMLTEIYIEALLADEDLADRAWVLWDAGEIVERIY